MNTIKKTITNFDAVNYLAWIEHENSFWATAKLPIKLQWNMKKNISTLRNIKNSYDEFYNKIQEKYSVDEYSEEKEQNGQTVRVVKSEHINDFNKELNDLLVIDNKIDLIQFDIDDFGNIDLDKNEMDMLSFFIKDDDEETKKLEKVDGEVVE